jgi:hypothetical protein
VNSIRPITFVEAPQAAAIAFAVAAAAVILLGVTQTMAASANARSSAYLRAAEVLPRGPARDAMLARAHEAIVDAVKLAPKNGEIRARDARALFLQATTATVEEVSQPLLSAAEVGATQAAKDSPDDAGATATLSLIAYARAGAATPAAVKFAAQSYAGRARDLETALWRAEAAGAAWSGLDAQVKLAAADETCKLLSIAQTRARAESVAVRMGDEFGICAAIGPAWKPPA